MLDILSLPNELLLNIFTICSTTDDAVILASTHRKLRAIWLKNRRTILKHIFSDAWNDAFVLAAYESWILADQNSRDALSWDTRLPLSFSLPRLLQNDKLARKMKAECTAWAEWNYYNDETGTWLFEHGLKSVSPASYYMLRLLVLAYEYPNLREPLYDKVKTISREELNEQVPLAGWLLDEAGPPVDILHPNLGTGSTRPVAENEINSVVDINGWHFAFAVVHAQLCKPELLRDVRVSLESYINEKHWRYIL